MHNGLTLTRRAGLAGLGAGLLAVSGRAKAAEGSLFKFQFDGRRPTVDVTLNGQPLRFLIDTGADRLAMPAASIARLGLPRIWQTQTAGLGGGATIAVHRVDELVVGGVVHLEAQSILALPSLRMPEGVDGILPVFNLGPAVMRFSDQTYDVIAPGMPAPPDIRIRYAIYHRRSFIAPKVILPVDLDGRRLRLALDTGAPGAVTIVGHSDQARELWNLAGSGPVTTAYGATGPLRAKMFRGSKLAVADLIVDRPSITVSDPASPSDEALEGFDGLLGIDVLQRFDLWLDASHQCYGMKPNGRPAPLSGTAEREVFL